MIINHNLSAMNANRMMNANASNASKSMEKLSSGLRINRAGDDAAGLAISEKMRGQIRGLDQASSNAQDGISLIQTAEGALNETHSILQRMRELSVQSATDTNTADDRTKIQSEVDQLSKEITRISNTTEFNTQNLLAGGLNDTFQVGANKGQNINLQVGAMDAQSLGVAGSKLNAVLAAGATDVTGATIKGDKGTAVVDGSAITIAAIAAPQQAQWAGTGTAGVNGITISTKSNTSDYNDWKFAFSTSGTSTVSAEVDAKNKTITLTGDTTTGTWTSTGIDSALSAIGYASVFSASGTATGVTATAATATSQEGLASDEVKLTATDTASNTGSVIVKKNAASAAFTDAKFKGLSISLDGSSAATGTSANIATINLATQQSSTATFKADGTINEEAVAAAGIDVSTQSSANDAIETINNAITTVSEARSKLGAYQNRLEHTINNLGTSSENLSSAESRIRDVDMAKEMSEYSKNNILSQASQAMLAQAKSAPEQVLQLLR